MNNEDLYNKLDEDESLTDAERREIYNAEQDLLIDELEDYDLEEDETDY